MLIRWLRRIADLGVDRVESELEAKHVRLTNVVAILGVLLMAAWVLPNGLSGSIPLAVWAAGWSLAFAPVLWLNARGWPTAASLLVVVVANAMVLWALWIFGAAAGVVAYSPVLAASAYLFFPPRKRPLAHVSAVLAATFAVLVIAFPQWWPTRVVLLPLNVLAPLNEALGLLSLIVVATAFARAVARTERGLVEERARADRLLLNVLPASVAERLKAAPEQRIADRHDEVSILFADIVGFTQLAGQRSAHDLVEMLNDLFSAFDAICEREGAERIKTMGDGYMAVCGLPEPRADHAEVIARVAQAICRYMRSEQVEASLQVRVGIHTGPVVAGVIGRSRFHYDLWGDTVNLASRMESSGIPGRVQLSEAMWQRIGETMACEARGPIAIKGKGELSTWLLVQD